jgi:hypothetical protein
MPPPPPSLGLGLSLVRGGVVGPATPALIPDAVWQVTIAPEDSLYSHPGPEETPLLTLPGGYHLLRLVVDQISPNYEDLILQCVLYDADFAGSRIAFFDGSDPGTPYPGLLVGEDSLVSDSDFYVESENAIENYATTKLSADFNLEVLSSSYRFGLFATQPNPSTSIYAFRLSAYILSSTPY